MTFNQTHVSDTLTWTVSTEEPSNDTSVTNQVQCNLEVDVRDRNAIDYPASIRISDINFIEIDDPEELIASPDDLPVRYSFEIPPGDDRPTITLSITDSSDVSETATFHLSHSEAIHLASRILKGAATNEIINSLNQHFTSISKSGGFRDEIEYFTSFNEYVQLLEFIYAAESNQYADDTRTVMKRVLRPHGRYTAESPHDLETKIEQYNSKTHLGTISTGSVIVEQIYDVLSKSNKKDQIQIDSLDEISDRFGLNHDWSDLLNENQLSLLLAAYYAERGPDVFEAILHRQDPDQLPGIERSEFLEHLADTLTEHAEGKEGKNVLSASLYEHAAKIYDEIGADEQAVTASVQAHIGTGFQAMQNEEYSTAREAFRKAVRESKNSSELEGLFIFVANKEATAIQEQFKHDGDLEAALDHIESLIELINNHASSTIHINEDAPLYDVTETKDYLKEKKEVTDIDRSEVPIPDDERDDESVEEVEREYTEVRRKKRDQQFRKRVKQVYDDTCAVCGSQRRTPDGRPEVEAAHIHPAGDDGPDKIKNSLALCKLHHWAFDNGWIAVNDNYSIIVRDAPHVNGYSEFSELDGKDLVLPNDEDLYPQQESFEYHRKEHGFETSHE